MGKNSMSITITAVKNPKWKTIKQNNVDTQVIDCEIQCDKFGDEWLSFGATPYDTEQHGKKLWEDLNNGVYGSIDPEN